MGSSKKTQTTKPIYSSQIEGAANTAQNAYNQNAGALQNIGSQFQGIIPDLISKYQAGDPTVGAANSYTQDVLSGKYLNSNPELENIIAQSNSDTRNGLESSLGTRGLTGGSAYADIISRNLAANDSNLRYTDYNNQLSRMDQAAANAAGISAAQYQPLAAAEAAAQGATLPITAAGQNAATIGGLLGQYTNTTQKSNPGLFGSIGQGLGLVGQGLQVASIFSDRRLKTDIDRVGELPDGLGVYEYRYIWSDARTRGVMADEVAKLRPWALGPTVNGFATVNYSRLGGA